MNISKNNVFVTGASGFIGSHLVQRLVELNCNVTALAHYNSSNNWNNLDNLPKQIKKKIRVISGDIMDLEFLLKATKKQDIVFHLAALISIPYSYVAAKMFVETNILGSLNVFQSCLRNKIKAIVHTSTSEVYGTARYVPIDERHPLQAQSPYAATKIAADKLAESFYKSFGLPIVTVRPFNTFGPRQSARAVIPTVITQLLVSRKIKIGSLSPVRDFNYVNNTVDGFIDCAQNDNAIGELLNIGYGEGVSIGALVNKVASVTGIKDFEIVHEEERMRPEKSEVGKLVCDYSKARRIIKYKPRVSFQDGLVKTIRWIEENIARYKFELYNI